jgi:predicted membrane channel-forming protein YqfA (hemolysin III family)
MSGTSTQVLLLTWLPIPLFFHILFPNDILYLLTLLLVTVLYSVTSIGFAQLPSNLSLNNVSVSPKHIKNLIFVRQFTTDNNCSVEFDPVGCSVKDLKSRNVIIRCNSSGPLYPLHLPAAAALTARSTSTLWHRRLGHPSQAVLAKSNFSCTKDISSSLCHASAWSSHSFALSSIIV